MTTSKHGQGARVKDSARPKSLPPWIEAPRRDSNIDELLLFALCGGRGERSLDKPLVALAERVAAEAEALSELLGPRLESQPLADLMQGFTERVVVLAMLLGRVM